MASLSDSAAKQLTRIKRRPDLPEWWTMFQIVCGVVVVVVIAFAVVANVGSDPEVDTIAELASQEEPASVPTNAPVTTVGEEPATTVGAPDTDPPATTTTTTAPVVSGDSVSLPFIGGSNVDVATAALERAQAVVVAAYSESAVVSDISVGFNSTQRIAFTMQVDPDGDGPQAAEQVSVVTVKTGESWTGSI